MENVKHITEIDNILGTSENRYLSNGFRNIEFEYSNLSLSIDTIACQLRYNVDNTWSKKANKLLKPHLGTVEYFAISAFMSEILLKIVEGLTNQDVANAWISDFFIKTRPNLNEESDGLSVKAKVMDSSVHRDLKGTFETIINIDINTINVTLKINHTRPYNVERSLNIRYATLLGNNFKNNLYTKGYKCSFHGIKNIKLNSLNHEISSTVVLTHNYLSKSYSGIGSNFLDANLITDHILTTGQLIQVLLYELDNLKREDSNNLWLRELKLSYPAPLKQPITTTCLNISESKVLKMKNENWRLATIEVNHESIKSTFKVSHKLS